MGFKQRERKRRKRAAMTQAQRSERAGGRKSRDWWLTLAKRDTCCATCSGVLRAGGDMVYRAAPREARCVMCADADPLVTYRPSVRWEARKA